MPKQPRTGLRGRYHRWRWHKLVDKIKRLNRLNANRTAKLTKKREQMVLKTIVHHKKGWDTSGP